MIDFMKIMSEPVEVRIQDVYWMCGCCRLEEATHQFVSDVGYFVCYGCWIAQKDVT